MLKSRIPSAGPQIWIRSSRLILRRSAPATTAGRLFCFCCSGSPHDKQLCVRTFTFSVFFFTWEAEEEPWERWEPVLLQPLLSVLRWGRWQKVLHVKEKRSPWNENSSTASTVSTIWPKRNERAALTPSHRAALRYLHQSSRPGADPAGLENSFYTTHTCEEETRGFCDWLKVWLRCLQKKVFYLQKMCCGSQLLHIYSNK